MKGYIARKIIYALITLYIIASLNFVIFQVLSPVDPFRTQINPNWTPEVKQMIKHLWGLDQPLTTRYVVYILNMFTFRFGISFMSWRPVIDEISQRLPNTLLLLGTALTLSIIIGVPLGILAASRRGSKTDALAIGGGLLTWSVPAFFLQLVFLLLFSYYTFVFFGVRVFPVRGITDMPPPENAIAYIGNVLHHLFLPVVTLVLSQFGFWALYSRNIMLENLAQDYVVTARAKGLSEREVQYGHAFKTALPPIVTMVALAIPRIFVGSIITEFVFSWPGIGYWFYTSMMSGDYPAAQGVLFIFAILMIAANFLSDLLYGWLDPRIRISGRK